MTLLSLGYVGLVPTQEDKQIADGLLARLKFLENAKPVGLSEGAEASRCQVKHLVRHRLRRHYSFYHLEAYSVPIAEVHTGKPVLIDVREYLSLRKGISRVRNSFH